jgi:tRNA threonylcarbamoyladenosine biosynthesis protein TsaB
MLILAIDTTSPCGSLALLRDANVLGVVSETSDEPYSSRLFRQLDLLFSEVAVEMPAVDLYAVAAGPGSFTGVRIGLTAVKGWAEVYAKPAVAVSALEALAEQAPARAPLIAAVADARRGQLYAGVYERTGEVFQRRGEDVVMTPGECFEYIAARLSRPSSDVPAPVAAGILFVTARPDWLRPLLDDSPFRGARIEGVPDVLAPAVGRLGYARALRGEVSDAASLDAHYVRRSDAELLWKEK